MEDLITTVNENEPVQCEIDGTDVAPAEERTEQTEVRDAKPLTIQDYLSEMRSQMNGVLSTMVQLGKTLTAEAQAQKAELLNLTARMQATQRDIKDVKGFATDMIAGFGEIANSVGVLDVTLDRMINDIFEAIPGGNIDEIIAYCDDCGVPIYAGQPHSIVDDEFLCEDCDVFAD